MSEMATQTQGGQDTVVVLPARPVGKRQGSRPNLTVKTSNENTKATTGQRRLATPAAVLTPPLTPSFSSGGSVDGEAASFHNYLRVLYDFHPDGPTPSETNEASITIPITRGDMVLVHTIQSNGWADGTLLSSGLRGWLPTNYCCVYTNASISVLLDAATFVWDFIRSNEGGDQMMFTRQDYVRRTIAGVRILLQRSDCLNRESPLIADLPGLRRLRKGLLGDLSAFAKCASSLQEACEAQQLHYEALFPLLDEVVLRAFKVVIRAVRFLDVWAISISGHGRTQPATAGLTTPPLSGEPEPSSTRPEVANEHSLGHSGHTLVTPLAGATSTSTECVSPSPDSSSATPLPHQQPPHPTTHTAHHLKSSTSSSDPSSFGVPPAPTPHPLPSTHPSISSTLSKRTSVSHRSSHSLRTSILRSNALVSERLHATHDTFLTSLGTIIGNHIQPRSSMDLLVTTQQSVIACQGLLEVVEQVCERDSRRSTAVDDARLAMHARLAELVQATKDVFEASTAPGDADAYSPEQSKRLMEAATMCVRGAGECVSRSRNVIDRIGDFEFEPVGLGLTGELERRQRETHKQNESKVSRTIQPEPETRKSVDKPLPLTPRSRISTLRSPEPTYRPSTATTLSRERASSSHSDCTDSTLLVPNDTHMSLRSSSLPRSPVNTDYILSSRHTRVSGVAPTFLTLDVDIPHTSFIDMTNSPTTASPSQSRFERSDSAGESVAESTNTYWSSVGHSGASDRASTRATTPDHGPYREPSTESFQGSVGSSEDADPERAHEAELTEAQVMVPTHAHELVHNKDGQIIGGTLPALVERLTTHDTTPDALFVNTFYLTFRLFTTPLALAQTLIARFNQTTDGNESSTPIRLRVSNVFKGWLETCWRPDTDSAALVLIRHFAFGRLQMTLPAASRRLIELITHVTEARNGLSALKTSPLVGRPHALSNVSLAQDVLAPNPIVSKSQLNALRNSKQGGQTCSILDFDPMELARQFTIKQSKIFCAIQPEELLALEWTKKTDSKAVNVLAMSSLSTDLANLVADTILQLELKKRAVVIKQWVKIANKCLDLGNYDALMAIICSLNSSMVLRLKKTWDLVSPKTLAKLDYLKTVVDVSRNYAVLRQRLSTHCAPCLPFVGIYLTDLTFVDAGNQSMRQLPGDCTRPSVINFDKHMKTAKIINDLQRFQIPHRLTAVPEMQDWMDSQISRVSNTDQASVQNYYRRSLMLEPREGTSAPPPGVSQKSPPESVSSSFPPSSMKESTKERFEFWGTKQFLMGNREKTST